MALRARVEAAADGRAVVLIDGRSGSGKSTLARALVAAWPAAQLVRLDDVYPGWDGLEAASLQVAERMLAVPSDTAGPSAAGASAPAWQRWDWLAGVPAEWHAIDPGRPLVIEGSGALSRRNRELATFGIWVHLDEGTRRARALERDGRAYLPHWDRWAAQELAFVERERPDRLADLVVDESRT